MIMTLRNIRKRKHILWPVGPGVMPVAPGEQFQIDDSAADSEGLRAAVDALVKIGWLAIEAGRDFDPTLH
jgi:hypothetical protein